MKLEIIEAGEDRRTISLKVTMQVYTYTTIECKCVGCRNILQITLAYFTCSNNTALFAKTAKSKFICDVCICYMNNFLH